MYIKFSFCLYSFNRECMERNVMTSFRILSSFGYFLCYFKQNDQFFLPFSVNCSQVAMFQIMPALCLHRQGEGGGQPNVYRPGQGEGASQKFPNLCRHSLWMTPIFRSSCSQVFFEVGFLKYFTIFTEKHLCRNLFFIKFQV